jgi:hypothetical protein
VLDEASQPQVGEGARHVGEHLDDGGCVVHVDLRVAISGWTSRHRPNHDRLVVVATLVGGSPAHWQRSAGGTSPSTCSMWLPHPL